MPRAVRIGKFFIKAFSTLLLVIIFLLLLLNLPWVQDRITGLAESFLSEKTNTAITVEKISVNLLGHLLLKEMTVSDQQQDTLLHLGKLEIGFQLREILSKKIRIKSIELDEVLVDLYPVQDTVMNYQFLIDAFGSTPRTEEPQVKLDAGQKKRASWEIAFPEARLRLKDVRFNFRQPDSALVMNYRVGTLEARTNQVDLLTGAISLDRLRLENSDVFLKIGVDSTGVPDTTTSTLNFLIDARELALANIRYRMELDNLVIDSRLGSATVRESKVLLAGDTKRIETARFDLAGSRYRMDVPSAPPTPGLDYSHLDVDDIEVRISNFSYDNLGVSGLVEQIAGQDKSGFELSGFQSRVHYTLDSIEVWQLHAATPRTRIYAAQGKVTFPFIKDPAALPEQMEVSLKLDSTVIYPEDIAYFLPPLEEEDLFRRHRGQDLRLNAWLEGTLADLAIRSFDLQGWDSRVNFSGRLRNITDMDRLEADLRIGAIESSGPGLRQWLAPGAIPSSVELPTDVLLRGQARGSFHRLALKLEATTSRPSQPVAARLQVEGQLRHLLDTKRLAYDVAIDTFWASNREITAYLPDSFPAYIELPQVVTLTGRLRGSMATIFADLDLEAVRGDQTSVVRIAGTVDSFAASEALTYDVKLRELIVHPAELIAYLPHSTLPGYLLLPLIEHGEGTFRGDLENITTQFAINTSAGTLEADMNLLDSTYSATLDLQDFQLQRLFKDLVAYDSIVGWPAPPLALQLSADGHGLDIDRDLQAEALLRLRFLGDTIHWQEGLVLEGGIDRRSFRGRLTAREREIDLGFSALADFNPGRDTLALSGAINKLDLSDLQIVEVPFRFNSTLNLEGRGRSLDSLSLKLTGKELNITYDTISESTKDFQVALRRFKARNSLGFLLQSDFGLAAGFNQATDPRTFEEGVAELLDNLDLDRSQLQLNPDSTQNLFLVLAITRPDIFTSGIIPGLSELAPISVLGVVDMQDSSLAVYADVPHLKYQVFEVDSVNLQGVNWENLLLGQLTIKNANLFEEIQVRDLTVSGLQRSADTVFFVLEQRDSLLAFDPEQPTRFQVVASVVPADDTYRIRFFEQPTLNFDKDWRIDPRNLVVYGPKKLAIENLRLFRRDQSLAIHEVAEDRIQVDFDNFDLAILSNTVKWKSDYLQGIADGQITIQDPLESFMLRSDLKIAGFGVLAAPLGDLEVVAGNNAGGAWNVEAALSGQGNEVALSGSYLPAEGAVGIKGQLRAQPLNLEGFVPLLKEYATDLQGALDAELTFNGTIEKPAVAGQAEFHSVRIRPLITGSLLEIPAGTIRFQENRISSPQEIVIRDSLGQEATLNLAVLLDNYPEIRFATQFDARNFLLLNTLPSDLALYYGTVYADVNVNMVGSSRDIIDINCLVKPQKGSSLVYVYDQGDELEALETGNGLVKFVDFETMESGGGPLSEEGPARNAGGVNLNLSAGLDENLDLTVIVNREAGDRLKGKAKGDIVFHYPPQGTPELTGQLDVSGSKYLFTYEKVIRKEFELQEGSTLTFVGPVNNPNLNLQAGYVARTTPDLLVTAFAGVDPNNSEDMNRLRRRQEFLVNVKAEGALEKAEISADIQYARAPGNNSADLVDPALSKLRSNPSEMNTQAFSLVIFNTFRLSSGSGSGKAFINLKQGLGNLVSNQLNNLASQYVNFVELDFGIETLNDGSNNLNLEGTDFRLGVKKRFLQDRLIAEVDGVASVGSSGSSSGQNMQSFLENVSLEYALNPKGEFRIKVYNQYDRDDFIAGNVLKIGGALLISRDFNRLLFKKKFQQPVVPADTLQTSKTKALESNEQRR